MEYKEAMKKVSEFRTLTNKLNRYWSKLVKEAFEIASERNLEVAVSEDYLDTRGDIVIYRKGEDIDASELIELTREKFPSLFRRYNQGLEKHRKMREELASMI